MAPKHHPTPLSGGDRKALSKELVKSRAMAGILAERSQEKRRVGEALIREADNLACQSWNEKMWSDGGPAQPSPTIGQAINGGFARFFCFGSAEALLEFCSAFALALLGFLLAVGTRPSPRRGETRR
jgi:hypothetical protein